MQLSKLADAIVNLKEEEALRIARQGLESGENPMALVDECRNGISIVGDRFQKGEYFLSELIMSGEIFKQVMALLQPKLSGKATTEVIGRMVLGTVKGDIHNIGKDIVGGLLRINGFEVFDLGIDVAPQTFADKLAETGATILGLSALITPSFESMKETVETIKKKGIRDKVKIVIGGGIVIKQVQDYVGADAFARDAADGVVICKRFLGR